MRGWWLAWLPEQLKSNLRASFTEQPLAVLTAIPVRLKCGLLEPIRITGKIWA
jgi:hypothetical protein